MDKAIKYLPLAALLVCIIAYAVNDYAAKDALIGFTGFLLIASYFLRFFHNGRV